jgi:hypothetical protein
MPRYSPRGGRKKAAEIDTRQGSNRRHALIRIASGYLLPVRPIELNSSPGGDHEVRQ